MSGRLQPCAAQLADGIAALGLALPQETVDRLLAFGELLLKWNKVYNLTAIRNPQEVITHHLLDSLAVLAYLTTVNRLADIGSGGGLPGVVLAIVRPALVVSSIETVGKKASFQQQAQIELGLGNFSVLNKRVEQVRADSLDQQGRPVRIATEELNVFPNAQRATSPAKVSMTQPGFILNGRGLDAQLDAKRIVLQSDVKARYERTAR